jgi:hypothetical protein
MKARHAILVLVALAVVFTLTSAAAARPDAAKQRVAIDVKLYPEMTFVLTPLESGPLRGDSGKISHNFLSLTGRDVMRDGQSVGIYDGGVITLTGKRGTLVIRERTEWVDLHRDSNRDGESDSIAIGTWKVVRGTGQYAGTVGKGGNAHVGLGKVWYERHEGYLTAP